MTVYKGVYVCVKVCMYECHEWSHGMLYIRDLGVVFARFQHVCSVCVLLAKKYTSRSWHADMLASKPAAASFNVIHRDIYATSRSALKPRFINSLPCNICHQFVFAPKDRSVEGLVQLLAASKQ
jgi:hypothetical protein